MRGWIFALVVTALAACSDDSPPAPTTTEPPTLASRSPDEGAVREVKGYVDAQVAELGDAVGALCAAAPEPDADGWSAATDPEAVERMRTHWRSAREAYERIEGAIAILFPQTDLDVDGRYEHAIALRRDPTPFDANGFIGMHAVERILWADARAPAVERFESALPFYAAARTPADETEARAFTEQLCARLVDDVRSMERDLGPVALDAATAWRGIQGSVEEQAEKVLLGHTGEDESRYASHTLADMRANLEGGRAVLDAFEPQLLTLPEGRPRLDELRARLEALEQAYREVEGAGLPPALEDFDPENPTEEDLATPFGRLFALLRQASDPRADGSLAAALQETGLAMGIRPLGR